jgi:hypothetical protein
MPPKTDHFDQEMVQLEAEIRRLEAEYNMFFAGRLPRLPWETRARVDALVKRYDRMTFRNTAERFRFASLQARYSSFVDLWERTLRQKEEGRPTRGRQETPTSPSGSHEAAAAGAGSTAAQKSGNRIVHVAALKDPSQDAERLMELYERLSAARKEAGEQPVPYNAFTEVVRAQVKKLGGEGTDVAFHIAVKDGKVTLTAKALKK